MRLLVTADLHYNHWRSRVLADELIERMNGVEADALLVVGDTAPAESVELSGCLARFRFDGPRLFVAGNHELWTRRGDSLALLESVLPRRLEELGWQDVQHEPYVTGDGRVAVVGSVGWYDYSFAEPALGVPRRFYEHKVSPAAAEQLGELAHLVEGATDIPPAAMSFLARWNDGRFVKLGRSDEAFLEELLAKLRGQLEALADVAHVVAAVHHLPFAELLPPNRPAGGAQWAFARAFLGSTRIGQVLQAFSNVRTVVCGHSHFPTEARVGQIHAINIGSGYRSKVFRVLEVPD